MKRIKPQFPMLAVAVVAATLTLAPMAWGQASQPERWLHVRVDNQAAKGEMVRVNVPLSMAEKVLPTIHHDRLHDGKITLPRTEMHGVDLHTLLDAARTARDGEFVTVQHDNSEVRVAKQAGYLLVHVRENKAAAAKRVEVRLPLTVVDALLSSGTNELDLVAGLRALSAYGDMELVSVRDEKSTVRIWLDSKNTSD